MSRATCRRDVDVDATPRRYTAPRRLTDATTNFSLCATNATIFIATNHPSVCRHCNRSASHCWPTWKDLRSSQQPAASPPVKGTLHEAREPPKRLNLHLQLLHTITRAICRAHTRISSRSRSSMTIAHLTDPYAISVEIFVFILLTHQDRLIIPNNTSLRSNGKKW